MNTRSPNNNDEKLISESNEHVPLNETGVPKKKLRGILIPQ